MLPTFVIGLREGLEAVLIVSIIAAFLKSNGKSLKALWAGVAAAVLLSVGVGVALKVVEQSLPQAQQEAMETVIGAIAVVFVTSMIVWMRTHARFMKKDLEGAAAEALGSGTAWALVAMVFLAVLKEGFESAVFLLATFSASSSLSGAAAGAVLGIAAAVLLGFGLYRGGLKLNLAKFFTVTSTFLVLVAAGLVLSALRTGHEAGWITIGQQRTVDLAWLAPNGSVRAALVTGVLGIPADPRQIEVLGWLLYLVPMLALVLWPKRWKLTAQIRRRAELVAAAVLGATAILLAVLVPIPRASATATAPLAGGGQATWSAGSGASGASGTLTVQKPGQAPQRIAVSSATPSSERGADRSWTAQPNVALTGRPSAVTLDTVVGLNGGRVPVGLSPSSAPGPYTARWTEVGRLQVLTRGAGLVDAQQTGRTLLSLSGGGLTSPRVMEVGNGSSWRVDPAASAATSAGIAAALSSARDNQLWKWWLPVVLAAAALVLVARVLLAGRRTGRVPTSPTSGSTTTSGGTSPSDTSPHHQASADDRDLAHTH